MISRLYGPVSSLGALLVQLDQPSQSPPVVLTGTSGVGKTQLTAAYARARLADNWRLIAWVNARDSETMLAGLVAVAEAAGLSVGGSRPQAADVGQAVRHWLEVDEKRRLLVFDDVEDPYMLRPFVPAAGAARVLINVTGAGGGAGDERPDRRVQRRGGALALLGERTGLADEDGALALAVQLGPGGYRSTVALWRCWWVFGCSAGWSAWFPHSSRSGWR